MNTFLKLCKQRGFQTVSVITLYLLFAQALPPKAHQLFFSVSKTIQEALLWVLPVVVCFFIAYTISLFKKSAPLFLLAIVIFEAISNSFSVWYAYACGLCVSSTIPLLESTNMSLTFSPLWQVPFSRPTFWSSQTGLFIGIFLGILNALFSTNRLTQIIGQGKRLAEQVLGKLFSPIIPIFILGFVARMHQQKFIDQMYTECAQLVCILVLFLCIYIAFLFLAGNSFSPKLAYQDFYNLLPAAGVAFTSGSGLATMPWTIAGTSKNLMNKDFAQAVIPATTNIQQIGDCIINAFLCFLLYQHFLGHPPDIATWLPFTCMFVLARFTTAAVLGGAIFIMIPIYESYLAFNAEMIAIILAFNVILDPIVTCSNVVANAALCKIFEKVWRPIGSLD